MTRHEAREQRRTRPLSGQGPRPETFYDDSRRPGSGGLAVVVAGLAVIALVLSGAITSPQETEGANGEDKPGARAYRQFLSDLPTYRPNDENVVESGVSRPGIPVSLDTRSFSARAPHRIAYRCQGTGTVTATALSPDGTRRRFPATVCGTGIASVAIEGYRSVTLAGDDQDALLLWAITTVRQTAPRTSTELP